MDVPLPPSQNGATALRKKKAKQRLVWITLVVVIAVVGYWYFEKSFSLPLQNIASFEYAVTSKVEDNFSAPPPLQQSVSGPAKTINSLTRAGVIADTNSQRAANGDLPALQESATLDDVAMLRIDDMFQNQYFAHVSPDGVNAEAVASSVGYSYLALGENLALGNFMGDHGVVTAWMNSPGHRANILNVHYAQIGVAVREGLFHNQNTWIAVQIFGKPASDCVSPDASLKASLDTTESQISALTDQLQQSKSAIAAMQPQSGSDYNQAVADYNALVAEYNNLGAQEQAGITTYDQQVDAFNACLNS